MILSEINDGLGNQLFKYATGLALSQKHGVSLKLEKHWFTHQSNSSVREYCLNHFAISAEDASYEEIDEYINRDTFFHRLITPYYKRIRVYEKAARYDPNFSKIPSHAYILGYWQSWRYFHDYKSLLLKEFTIITEPEDKAIPYLELVESGNSVGIHIRRGDYITNPSYNVLSLDYYRSAAQYLQKRYQDLSWFIFSDDLEWAKQNVDFIENPVFVEGLNSIDDFRLLNKCKHNVIANSTYSWWAAYLKNNSDCIVIAPKQSFPSTSLYTLEDFYPPKFILV
jgi:hypothetical protein